MNSVGLRCHGYLNPMERGFLFNCGEGIYTTRFKSYEIYTYKIPMGLFPMGYDPMNQTTSKSSFDS
jgi:hypothetical protein